ncbi:hypothetical protein E4K10_35610 [Streptomyces sp. T1317-0309]|nr:hypothetical protein E4K10_35610 [Streptomyces sp. T1317-0309]
MGAKDGPDAGVGTGRVRRGRRAGARRHGNRCRHRRGRGDQVRGGAGHRHRRGHGGGGVRRHGRRDGDRRRARAAPQEPAGGGRHRRHTAGVRSVPGDDRRRRRQGPDRPDRCRARHRPRRRTTGWRRSRRIRLGVTLSRRLAQRISRREARKAHQGIRYEQRFRWCGRLGRPYEALVRNVGTPCLVVLVRRQEVHDQGHDVDRPEDVHRVLGFLRLLGRFPAVAGVSIWSHASGRCIDVSGGRGNDGTPLDIWDCGGTARMKWQFMSDGTVRAMGKCMDVAWGSSANGAVIQLANCSGNPAQQFRLNSAHDLVNPQADKCVDVKDEGTGNGTRLQLWSCNGQDNQKWSSG